MKALLLFLKITAAFSVAIGAWAATEPISTPSADELRAGFQQPPASAKPWVYWFIMDGNLTREGITADLEAMARAGLGGFILMEVDMGIAKGPVKFMSPEWQELFRHTVREAQRLGLQVTLNAGPGWTGSGGPWVTPAQSMQHLIAGETNLTGPSHFASELPRPLPRKPFFGEGALPPDLEAARKSFYRDVAVLAFPTPEGSARLTDVDEKALYLRAPYSSQPGVRPFLPAPSLQKELPREQCVATNQIVDLTDRLSPDGRLVWDVPAGNWTVLRFVRASTGQNTRPAPLPGLGLESDKFDPAALDAHFNSYIEPLVRGLNPVQTNGAGWTMLHIDSWEMSSQNWTAGFREAFLARRGYDPLPYLPTLTGRVIGSVGISERFLWDLRQTAQELVVQNHALHLKELGRKHGFGLSIEPYDMNPCADLTLGGAADVPMCEFWSKGFGFDTDFTCFEAVSIAHTLGKPIVAAESFTADGEGWVQYPGSMKGQGDWALATGINRIVFHRYQHQPWLDRSPGMTMGSIGVHWERTQTWWEFVPAYHQYLTRCQYLLRSGLPVADICYVAAEGAPHVFRPPPSATRNNPPDRLGHNFDGCAPEVLRDQATVQGGRVLFPGGMSYALLVLPMMETMRPELLRNLLLLVQNGATMIGSPPRTSPSLSNFPECDNQVLALSRQLWGDGESTEERIVGKGRVFRPPTPTGGLGQTTNLYPSYEFTAATLKKVGVEPDFESAAPLRYTHRRLNDSDIYFVSNPTPQRFDTIASFRVSGQTPELWDPVSGEQRALPEFTSGNHRTTVPLQFEPHQAYFLVFGTGLTSRPAQTGNFPAYRSIAEVLGPWTVTFEPKRGAPERLEFPSLVDWSKHSDPAVRHFSGIATYQTEFNFAWPASHGDLKPRTFLDLGRVQVMASVTLNGQDLGVVWTTPFQIEATSALRPGTNTLQIRVANLWGNRLIGDAALPVEQRITWTTWNPYKPDAPLLSSGLLGPVQLMGQAPSSPERP